LGFSLLFFVFLFFYETCVCVSSLASSEGGIIINQKKCGKPGITTEREFSPSKNEKNNHNE
jgi:hypothetical protein